MEGHQFRIGKVDYYVKYVGGKVHFSTTSCTKMNTNTLPTIIAAYREFFKGFHRNHKTASPYQNKSRVTISFPVSESRFNRWIQTSTMKDITLIFKKGSPITVSTESDPSLYDLEDLFGLELQI